MDRASLGTWMWNVMDLWEIDQAVDFLWKHQVNQAYVSYSRAMPKEQYRRFAAACGAREAGVAILAADAQWITPQGEAERDRFAAWLRDYLAGCKKPEERFYALHLDIEPHQLPAWETQGETVRRQYAAFLEWARALCDGEGLLLEADIPFWFDSLETDFRGKKLSLGEIALELCDATLLMSYRDNAKAVVQCGEKLMPLARRKGKKLIFGLETGKIYEEINITFHHLGTQRMYRELKKLHELVCAHPQAGEVGYAVHYYESWRKLPPKGHPKLADFPYDNPNYAAIEVEA